MEPLTIAVFVLLIAVIVLAVLVFALTRQVGILFERVAPMGALMTDAGPKIGEASPKFELASLTGADPVRVGRADGRSMLLFFLSPTCPVCKKLLPVLRSAAKAERGWLDIVLASDGEQPKHETFVRQQSLDTFPYVLSTELGMTFRVNRLPYAVLVDGEGVVRSKGLINNREQLESLFNAKEMGVPSIQTYLDEAASVH